MDISMHPWVRVHGLSLLLKGLECPPTHLGIYANNKARMGRLRQPPVGVALPACFRDPLQLCRKHTLGRNTETKDAGRWDPVPGLPVGWACPAYASSDGDKQWLYILRMARHGPYCRICVLPCIVSLGSSLTRDLKIWSRSFRRDWISTGPIIPLALPTYIMDYRQPRTYDGYHHVD